MTKQDYIKSMRSSVGGAYFITVTELCAAIGMKKTDSVKKYVTGLPRLNGKYYFIPEVAEKMMLDTRCE